MKANEQISIYRAGSACRHFRTIGFLNRYASHFARYRRRVAADDFARRYVEIVTHLTPSGRAWSIARQDPLCSCLTARLAINNGEGDYAHDGDIGGGQYLNACTWFENLTGQSCIGNTFRPVYTYAGQEYTLSEELITVLQQAAHQAVEEVKNSN